MEPAAGTPAQAVPADADIRSVMDLLRRDGRPVGVTEDGRLLGQVTKDTVLARLLDPRG
jgi:glycine betaine/proline transport system ATP-binding protein